MAGSAAVALLVLPLIHGPLWEMVYLLFFGLGTIAGMMLITAAIAVPVSYSTASSSYIVISEPPPAHSVSAPDFFSST